MKNEVFNKLTSFLDELEQKGIGYTLFHHREDAIMALVALPGERWEIEFFGDGSVEIERFTSNGEIYDENLLRELFARYTDQEDDSILPAEAELTTFRSKVA